MDENSSPDKSPQRIRRMFDAVAPRYDFLNHLLSLGIDRSWRRKTARTVFVPETVSGPILDVCCGTADLALALDRRGSRLRRRDDSLSRRDIVGIDFSSEMVGIGRKKIEKRGRVDAIRLQVGDALKLPFEDETFALVTVGFGLRNLVDPDRGLSEMVRVCRSGGCVAVLEFSMPTLPVLSHLYRFYFRSILPRIGRALSRNSDTAYHYLPESVLTFDKPAELRRKMESLGLLDPRSRPMTFGIATLTWGNKRAESRPAAFRSP